MSFPWNEYLTLAETLLDNRAAFAHEEACYRAAISRAYYAAYCAARNHALDNEGLIIPNRRNKHQYVITHYTNGRRKEQKVVGVNLGRLRTKRNRADYDNPNIDRVADLAQHALNESHQIFAQLRLLAS